MAAMVRSGGDLRGGLSKVSVAVVYNPVSGAGRAAAVASELERGLRARGRDVVLAATRREPADSWLGPVLAGAECVVVVGGDGAVRLVAPLAAKMDVPLWHAPCGTENLFARAFGMRADADRLHAALSARRTRSIDLGTAGSEPFAIMAGIGFDADVVHALAARRTGAISHLSYAAPIAACLNRWRPPGITWTIDGEREELGRGMVVVGNLPNYGGKLNPAAAAVPDDGFLDAVFLPADSAWSLSAWVPLLWTGLHRSHPSLRERRGREIRIELSAPALVQVDGDPAGFSATQELAIGLRDRPLRVLDSLVG
jgi:diacylglycerol kinase family enzyme